MKKATLQDVANKAGVSCATASYALNRKKNIASKTREAVIAAASALNYELPKYARRTIGILLSHQSGISDLLRLRFNPLRQEIFRRNYLFVITDVEDFDMFEEWRIDGVISFDASQMISKKFPLYRNIPLLCYLDLPNHFENVYSIFCDTKQNLRQMLEYFIENGHERIGYCKQYNPRVKHVVNYPKVFNELISEMGLNDRAFIQTYDDKDLFHGDAIGMLLEKDITALFSQESMHEVLERLSLYGKRVPEDIALIVGDTSMANFFSPRLSTLGMDNEAAAVAVLDALEKIWEGGTINKDIIIPGVLTVRDSSCTDGIYEIRRTM